MPHHYPSPRTAGLRSLLLISLLLCAALHSPPDTQAVPSTPALRNQPLGGADGVASALTGPLTVERSVATATLLANGKVLVVGGIDPFVSNAQTADIYDPATRSFAATASALRYPDRSRHTATRLASGDVLVIGGHTYPITSAVPIAKSDLYDPIAGAFRPAADLRLPRAGHTATLLPDGRILIIGGVTVPNATRPTSTTEIYDPSTGTFALGANLSAPRIGHSAILLNSGEFLIAGGVNFVPISPNITRLVSITQTELYNPQTGRFRPGPHLLANRERHTATLLPNGKVLFAGGINWFPTEFSLATAELYDPASNTITATGPLRIGRQDHTAALLPSGKVLIAGGLRGMACPIAEIYDPSSGVFADGFRMHINRFSGSSVSLADGSVLLSAGVDFQNRSYPLRILRGELIREGPGESPGQGVHCLFLPVVGGPR